jgi:hypothetical protein
MARSLSRLVELGESPGPPSAARARSRNRAGGGEKIAAQASSTPHSPKHLCESFGVTRLATRFSRHAT